MQPVKTPVDGNKTIYQIGLGIAMVAMLYVIIVDNIGGNNQAILQLATGTFGTIVGFIISQLSGKQAVEQTQATQAQTMQQVGQPAGGTTNAPQSGTSSIPGVSP